MSTTLSFVDCLAHLDDSRIDDRTALLSRAHDAGVAAIINAGVDPANENWEWSSSLQESPTVHRAFGIHPMAARANQLESQLHLLKERLSQGPAVAIGEIGLDTRKGLVEAEVQEALFTAQLDLAHELELPVILHCVAAHGRMVQLLRARGHLEFGGMVHGFTGSWEIAQDYLAVGLNLSFGGLVTRPNSKKAHDTAKRIPLERLLIESDCPDHPASGWQPEQSEPASVSLIIQSLAEFRGVSAESIAQATTDNATALFGLMSR